MPLDETEKERILTWAKNTILDEGGIPVVLFAPKERVKVIIAGHMPTQEVRKVGLALCGMELANAGCRPEEIILVNTAWSVTIAPDEALSTTSPSHDPRRREVLVLLYSTGPRKHCGYMYYIERTADGPVFQDGPEMNDSKDELQVPMLDAFWVMNRLH